MKSNEQLSRMREHCPLPARESHIRQTVSLSQELLHRQQSKDLMSGWEFLWSQFQLTRKRWWVIQGLLLLYASSLLPTIAHRFLRVRCIGIIGCLFSVFMIPELWRNKSSESTQVEAACLYSLREIYAARITLFGLVDVLLLTLFCQELHSSLGLSLLDLMGQFLLPVTVTACICLRMLSGKRNWSETASVASSLVWAALWWLIVVNERLYVQIVPGIWGCLFFLALFFLAFSARKAIQLTNQSWEVDICEITAG